LSFYYLSSSIKPNVTYSVQLVTRSACKFDCHDGEVNAVKFHKNGKFFATGGGDRKIKLWEYKDNKVDCFGSLIGSNASIASVDIDNEVIIMNTVENNLVITLIKTK
jgi:WD40 repeat protein